MEEKVQVLTYIQKNGWPSGIREGQLVIDLTQYYGLSIQLSNEIIHECLLDNLIAITNGRYQLTKQGRNYLSEIFKNNYIATAHKVANQKSTKRKASKFRSTLELLSWIAGIIAVILTAYQIWKQNKP